MRPTISDIARRAGVSKATVSRVLNNRPDVDKSTREKITLIIDELNYSPSVFAKSLSTGRKNLIGLMVPSLSTYFGQEIVRGVAAGLEDTQFEMVLNTAGLSGDHKDLLSKVFRSDLVDGLIVLLPRYDVLEFIEKILHIPVLAIDYIGIESGLPSISVTNKKAVYEITNYLINLGHRKIGFITGLMDLGSSKERLDGFISAMCSANLVINEHFVGHGDFSRLSGAMVFCDWLKSKELPTAVIASNDEMAFGVMEAANKNGIKVPEQLSIIGFDDVYEAKFTNPPLTTVKQPFFEMGKRSVDGIIKLIEGNPFTSIQLETKFINRSSCMSPRS